MSELFQRFGAPVFLLCLVASVVTAAKSRQAPASPPAAAPNVAALGPQVGHNVPDFTLLDQHGQEHSLSSLMGPKGLILVFNRSADW